MESKNKEVDHIIIDYLDNVSITSVKDRLDNDIFHFEILSIDTQIRGSGSSPVEEIAFLKAQYELVERLVFFIEKKKNIIASSSGFAAHKTLEEAKEGAYCELLERDSFLVSWFSGKYPNWSFLENQNIDCSYFFQNKTLFQKKGFLLRVSLVGKCDGRFCVLSSLHDEKRKFGFAISTASDLDIKSAISKVIIDQRRVATLLINQSESKESYYPYNKIIESPGDHMSYYLNQERSNEYDKNYFKQSEREIILPTFKKSFIEYQLPKKISEKVKVVQCVSKSCQNYFVGEDLKNNINRERLRDIGRLDKTRKMHPLG